MQENWKEKLRDGGCEADLSGIKLNKVLLDKKGGGVSVLMESASLPTAPLYSALKSSVGLLFPGTRVTVRINR